VIFKPGETKPCGVSLGTIDNSPFTINGATYQYRDEHGDVVSSGSATSNGKQVTVSLSATVPGSLRFSISITDSLGNAQVRNPEIEISIQGWTYP